MTSWTYHEMSTKNSVFLNQVSKTVNAEVVVNADRRCHRQWWSFPTLSPLNRSWATNGRAAIGVSCVRWKASPTWKFSQNESSKWWRSAENTQNAGKMWAIPLAGYTQNFPGYFTKRICGEKMSENHSDFPRIFHRTDLRGKSEWKSFKFSQDISPNGFAGKKWVTQWQKSFKFSQDISPNEFAGKKWVKIIQIFPGYVTKQKKVKPNGINNMENILVHLHANDYAWCQMNSVGNII